MNIGRVVLKLVKAMLIKITPQLTLGARQTRARQAWVRCCAIGCLLLAALQFSGCGQSEALPSADEKSDSAAKVTKAPTEKDTTTEPRPDQVSDQVADASSTTGDNASNEETTIPEPTGHNAENADDNPKEQIDPPPSPKTVERFLLLAPGSPLVVELVMTINGATLEAGMEPVIEQALAAGDVDGDGAAMWDEVLDHPRFKYGGFGNMRATEAAQRKQIKQVYDSNRDEEMNRDEVFRFITNDQGGGRAFSLMGRRYDRGYFQERSQVRQLLDQDHDLRISPDEIEDAPSRLLSRDADDDAIVSAADFAPPSELRRRQPRRRSSGTRSALVLGQSANWNRILTALEEAYADGFELASDSFPLLPGFFEQLDADGDELITRDELELLRQCDPHVQLNVAFAENGKGELALNFVATPLEQYQRESAEGSGRVVIDLPYGEVAIQVPASATPDESRQSQALLEMYDTDSNGYLDKDELATDENQLMAPLEALDINGDGKAYPDEIEQFMSARQAAGRSRIHADVSHGDDALLAALDTNRDGRLSERETRNAALSLRGLDRDEDGAISIGEVPDIITIAISRGQASQQQAGQMAPPRPIERVDAPRWFLGMDGNQDNEISQTEFLGDAEAFEALDRSGDGFIDAQEARADAGD